MTLTIQQHKALLFIETRIARSGGVSPNIREIAQHLGEHMSTSTAHKIVKGLEARGYLRSLPRRANAIEVLRPVSKFLVMKFDNETKRLMVPPE